MTLSVLHAIAEAATREVDAGGLRFRIRKITSADLLATGKAMLAAVPPAKDGEAEPSSVEDALRRVPDGVARALVETQAAVVAAGTVAVYGDTEGWVDVRLVTKGTSNPDAGVLVVSDLPNGVEGRLYEEILNLSMDGEGAAERIATFRGLARDGANSGQDRKATG